MPYMSNVVDIVESLNVDELRQQLRDLEREEAALKLLLRAAIARQRDQLGEGRYPKLRGKAAARSGLLAKTNQNQRIHA